MKRTFVLILLSCLVLTGCTPQTPKVVSPAPSLSEKKPVEFQTSQCYELADLVNIFASYNPGPATHVFNNEIDRKPMEFLYRLDKAALPTPHKKDLPNYFGGKIGLVFNGQHNYVKRQQTWENGLLINHDQIMGYTADFLFLGGTGWGFNAVEITLPQLPPARLCLDLNPEKKISGLVDFHSYFETRDFAIKLLDETGQFVGGKTLWELVTPTGRNLFLICWQSSGSSGRIGGVSIFLYYTKDAAWDFYKTLKGVKNNQDNF